MILSKNLAFSTAQAITATTVSTDKVDLGVAGTPYDAAAALTQDIGKGTPVCVLIQVVEDFNNLTSLTVTLETSANPTLGSPKVLATEVILLADLVAGKQTFLQVLPNGVDRRYLGVRYTVAGTAPTTGAVTAAISMGNQTNVTGA